MVSPVIIVIVFLFFLIIAIGVFFVWLSWNIPIVILSYFGDKRRPMIKLSKGRKSYGGGVWRLFVRGYKLSFRDFKREHYYPTGKGKHGALLLWEFKPGHLTPLVPKLKDKKLNTELHDAIQKLVDAGFLPVDYDHDEKLYQQLLLKAVDDTDMDWMIDESIRTEKQYTVGWRSILAKYANHIVIIMIAALLLAGFIVWLDKAPEMLGQCSSAAVESTRNILDQYAGNIAGRPPV